jgi:hypothetical protein
MNRRGVDHFIHGSFEPLPRIGVQFYSLFRGTAEPFFRFCLSRLTSVLSQVEDASCP